MKSATSYSKGRWFYPALWKKNMARFWPLWAAWLVLWTLLIPVALLLQDRSTEVSYVGGVPMTSTEYFARVNLLGFVSNPAAAVLFLAFGILSAMAVFSYLYSSRSAGFFHALPVRREGLFLTSVASGLSFAMLPTLAVFLLTLVCEAALGCLWIGPLGMWLAMSLLMELFFFSAAAFCAMFTGHILAMPVFSLVFNFLAIGVAALLDAVLSLFVFGYSTFDGLYTFGAWLSPAMKLSQGGVRFFYDETGNFQRFAFQGLGPALVFAFAGVVLLVLALLLYRRRQLESAGDVVSVPWVRPVFKYGMGFCCALAGGILLYQFFSVLSQSIWLFLALALIAGMVGYFAAQMLLSKSFRVFRRYWPGCLGLCAALFLLTAGVEMDVTGYQSRVPDPEDVASVTVDLRSSPSDDAHTSSPSGEDPALIQAVTGLHQSILDDHRSFPVDWSGQEYYGAWEEVPATEGSYLGEVETASETDVRIDYVLSDGSTLSRRYSNIPVDAARLSDPDSPPARILDILDRPEVLREAYFGMLPQDAVLTSATIDLYDVEQGEYDTFPVPAEYRDRLLEAVLTDIGEGHLPRYLLDSRERYENCYVSDLMLQYRYTDSRGSSASREVCVTLQTTASHSLDLLREAGVLTQDRILETHAQSGYRDYLTWEDGAAVSYGDAVDTGSAAVYATAG